MLPRSLGVAKEAVFRRNSELHSFSPAEYFMVNKRDKSVREVAEGARRRSSAEGVFLHVFRQTLRERLTVTSSVRQEFHRISYSPKVYVILGIYSPNVLKRVCICVSPFIVV